MSPLTHARCGPRVAVPLLITTLLLTASLLLASAAAATEYHVGPGQSLAAVGEVSWESLAPGDHVFIHYQPEAYHEKWVIGVSGTAAQPIVVSGVPGPNGHLPVIDGRDATTREALDYTNQGRGVIKIGSANVPADTLPEYIVIEQLEVRSARPPFSFVGADGPGDTQSYADNAAAIYVEKAAHLTIRDCLLHDAANGLFIGVFGGQTEDVLVQRNWIYDNGLEGSIYQHNSYTAALGIIFELNHYGPLRDGCDGNNLKDRSAGTVVRYNWIEGGNRQLDLVDGEDDPVVPADPAYHQSFVYGNLLIEPDGAGNSQIVHYGGDSGNEADYRKGTLYFYGNTVVSTRVGNTTLLRLSTNDEHAEVRSNILYVTDTPDHLALVSKTGVVELTGNWLAAGWVDSHEGGSFSGAITDGGNVEIGSAPGFMDEAGQDYHLAADSPCLDTAAALDLPALGSYPLDRQYVKHREAEDRPVVGPLDIGAFERCAKTDCPSPKGQPDDPSPGGGSSSGGPAIGNPAGGAPRDEGGCGCRAAGARVGPMALWGAMIALLMLGRRRRAD